MDDDTPWAKYYAALIPTFLGLALCGAGMALYWTPIPPAVVFGCMAAALAWFLIRLERRRRHLVDQPVAHDSAAEDLRNWQDFRASRRKEKPWIALFSVFLVVSTLAFIGVSTGTILFAAGVVVMIADVLFVGPWLYSDIELRMRQRTS